MKIRIFEREKEFESKSEKRTLKVKFRELKIS